MATIIVEKLCGCAKKENWVENTDCTSLQEALTQAGQMCEYANENFCHKHEFSVEVDGEDVRIKVEINNDRC
jgi:hypothetical protein